MLLVDCCDNSAMEIDIKESNIEKGLVRFRGKFQEAEAPNRNRRIYPYSVLAENVSRLQDVVRARGLIGELDHASDSIVHFKEASHIITKLWWGDITGNQGGNILYGEGEILNTAHGRQLKALLNDGVRVGMSSRGVGNGKVNPEGMLIIGESYKLITFDAVADPSTFQAFQEKIITKKENFSQNNITKNESRSIYNLTKETVIAAIGGVIKEKTNKIKSEVK